MAAYAVFIKEETLDQSELDIYTAKIQQNWAAFDAFSPKLLAATGEQQVIEGGALEAVVILEFPTVEHARQWYGSTAYQAMLQHRLKGGRFRSFIVAGVEPAATST